MMKKLLSFLAALGAVLLPAQAKVTLPSFFSDNMVLQQQEKVAVWGWTDSGKKVTVKPSWTKAKTVAVPDASGRWEARIATPAAGGPYEIAFSDGEKLVLSNVLIGEVWFCSGQSNMEMPVKGFSRQPVEGSMDVIMSARRSLPVRMCTIRKSASLTEKDVCEGSWQENVPGAVAGTSAAAYFFALRLQSVLDVPVGILISSWGGSTIEAWIPRDVIERDFAGEFDMSHFAENKIPEKTRHKVVSLLYNGQVAPLVPFTFKGILWYQGESNRHREEQYTRLQPAYVKMMREKFQNPDAPFYFVQIAPYRYGGIDKYSSGYFYEAQEKTLSLIPHSGMAPTVDIGELGTIHPCKKRQVGDRLAYLALSDTYGVKGFNPIAPSFKSARFDGAEAAVTFEVDKMGLSPMGRELEGFELAGEDRVFHPAKGILSSKKDIVIVTSDAVPQPVAVRYCFHNWCVGTLFNCFGIPALPFRTDDWKL